MKSFSKKLNNIFADDLKSLLKKGNTTRDELLTLAKLMKINDLKVGWLSDYDPNYNGPQILNLGSNIGYEGTHWVCAYQNEYFDSFGLAPPNELSHLNWTPLQIQKIDEEYCGQYCLMFIHYKKINEIDKFYNHFNIIR